MRRYRRNKKKNIKKLYMIIGILLVSFMSVGYAILSSNIKIIGNANITADINVVISSIKVSKEKNAKNISTSITNNQHTGNIKAEIARNVDSYIIYNVIITNTGMFDVVINGISGIEEANNSEPKNIQTSISGINSNNIIKKGENKTFNIKLRNDTNYSTDSTATNKKITFNIEYKQYIENESGIVYNSAYQKIKDLIPIGENKTASGAGIIEKISHTGVEEIESKNSYRYRGKNPNNYVMFNDEVWRIIGIVDGKVKLVRSDIIGRYTWDNKDTSSGAETNKGKNNWSDSRIMKLLNPDYNDIGGSLYWNRSNGLCYDGVNNGTINCDFTNIGLNQNARNMIGLTSWYLGSSDISNVKTDAMYEIERSNQVYNTNNTTWSGYVGLMYPSDYGYATLDECSNQYLLSNYNNSICTNNNWLYLNNYEWLITSMKSNSYGVLFLFNTGYVYGNKEGVEGYVASTSGVRPTLYLKETVTIINGTGSSSNPYILK